MNEQEKEKDYSFEGLNVFSQKKSFRHKNTVPGSEIELGSVNGIYLMAALLQVFLGTVVTTLSILKLIQPGWLAGILMTLGSISTIFGLFFFYSVFSKGSNFDSLINKAIKRVITFQN